MVIVWSSFPQWVHSLLPLRLLTLILADLMPPVHQSTTKQVENPQHRDGNKPRGRMTAREETKNIQFLKTSFPAFPQNQIP